MTERNKNWQEIQNNHLQHAGDVLMSAMCIDVPFTGSKQYSKQTTRPCNKQLG